MSPRPRSLVIIPTYNERENLPLILASLFAAAPEVDVLVVDDGSPDGTGSLADEIAAGDERVSAQHRTGKLGLGSAYLQGFAWGLEHGYDHLIEMDADGSHPPSELPAMISAVDGSAGVAIGSRWVKGGSVVNWPRRREALSRGANLYARFMLGVPVRDATAGFRVYRADVLRSIDLDGIDSKGYCFQIDMTLRVIDAGFEVVEHPIQFKDRELGESKMSGSIVGEAMTKVTLWGIRRRARQLLRLLHPR
ncbi:MAG: Dolichyl-phosphate beta-D-mannosyltransferase [Aeromicrobium sp.]|nr:Dolichyl-phosphate beta-D-mannosyltransferase [Aeromicrobium sp.]